MNVSPYIFPGLPSDFVLKQIGESTEKMKDIKIQNIINTVISKFNYHNYTKYKLEDLQSKSRKRELVDIRHCVMYYLRNNTEMGLAAIGAILGCRDHSTVLHGIKKWKDLSDTQRSVRVLNNNIEQKLKWL